MSDTNPSPRSDCTIVGASFAGLACATVLAKAGFQVRVLEKKSEAGEKLHTTGIIVKEAVEQTPLLDGLPSELVRTVPGVRLYAPNMRFVDLEAPGYYFLATDTPNVMRWLAEQAQQAGVVIDFGTPFRSATRTRSGFELPELGSTRYLVGADGPNSLVAKSIGLSQNQQFLFGMEYEIAGDEMRDNDRLHCFIDRRLAPGYIGWIVPGVGVTQVGLARRMNRDHDAMKKVMDKYLDKVADVHDFRDKEPVSIRAGMIPCGGVVAKVATERALLVGDAAGMVSPVTAGGIHTALKHGQAAGHAIADFLAGKHEDPSQGFARSYPKFRTKRMLRWLFDHFQSDTFFNLMLATRPMRMAASQIYFHSRGAVESTKQTSTENREQS